jgi:hypothetical protein
MARGLRQNAYDHVKHGLYQAVSSRVVTVHALRLCGGRRRDGRRAHLARERDRAKGEYQRNRRKGLSHRSFSLPVMNCPMVEPSIPRGCDGFCVLVANSTSTGRTYLT